MTQTDDLLAQVRHAYPEGVPNLFRTLTGNRAVLAGFMALDSQLENDGVLTPAERLIVGLITATHVDVPDHLRYRALFQATQRLLVTHGRLPRAEIAHFARFGLDEAALLEVIAVIGEFTIATHANNLVRTRIDPEYRDADQS